MKAKSMVFSLWVIASLFIFQGIVLADGGGPDPTPGCKPLPQRTQVTIQSPQIKGFFTAAYDKSQSSVGQSGKRHYNIHVVLKSDLFIDGREKKQRHLFSFPMPVSEQHICSFSDEELKEKYKYAACNQGVAKAFGLEGIPVITDLQVKVRDACDDPSQSGNAMIFGTITLRVVKLP